MRNDTWYLDASGTWYATMTQNCTRCSVMTKDPTKAMWASTDIDWNTANPFHVYLVLGSNPTSSTVWEVTSGTPTIDPSTGVYMYTYSGSSTAEQKLKPMLTGMVLDPAAGTVKFLRAPASGSLILASYSPRAYRLTSSVGGDQSPFALLDRAANPQFSKNPLNFYNSGGSAPPTDRMWLFWRRPSFNSQEIGLHYETFRYAVQLYTTHQIGIGSNGKPMITNLTIGQGNSPLNAVEVDWVRNRLNFTSAENGMQVMVQYTDSNNNSCTQYGVVEMLPEVSPTADGSAFGNLSQVMVNEGQICAFKDPSSTENKLWAFWTSTRAGSTELYYEAISPRFYGIQSVPSTGVPAF
jgi:hypothetical protein